jgi:hypothetical protein
VRSGWYAIQQPYHLSVTYEVCVVNLDAINSDSRTIVSQRRNQFLGPEAAQ